MTPEPVSGAIKPNPQIDQLISTTTTAPPDWSANYQQTVVQPCLAGGGHVSGYTCVYPPPDPQTYARGLVDASQWPCLYQLWMRESGWNPYAVNAYSGAYGIPQSLGHGHVYDLGDGVAQVNWGMAYIRASYGSPCGAWAHSLATGWY